MYPSFILYCQYKLIAVLIIYNEVSVIINAATLYINIIPRVVSFFIEKAETLSVTFRLPFYQ